MKGMKVRRAGVALIAISSTLGGMSLVTAPQAAAAPGGCVEPTTRTYHIKGTLGYPTYASVGINLTACPHQDPTAWTVAKNGEENVGWWGDKFQMQVQGILNTGPVTPNDRSYTLRVIRKECPDLPDWDLILDGSCHNADEWDVHLRLVRENGTVRLEQNVTSPDGGPLDSGFQFTWD